VAASALALDLLSFGRSATRVEADDEFSGVDAYGVLIGATPSCAISFVGLAGDPSHGCMRI
jgi:hypothetical protein